MAGSKPQNIDLQYVAARCIEDDAQRDQAFADLHAKAPRNGWLAFAAAYTHAQHARWQDALPLLEAAYGQLPAMRERLALDTLRVRRMMSVDGVAQSSDLASQSPAVRYYMSLGSNAGLEPGLDMAYYHLGAGAPGSAAEELKRHSDADPRALRLAAASDGASREIVDAALQLAMDQGIDPDSIWSALALALRERKDPAPYLTALRAFKIDDTQQVLDFIATVRRGTTPAEAERLLEGLDLTLRGHAYSVALVLQGERAPAEWRRGATSLLFIPERPYFAAPRAEVSMARVGQDGRATVGK